MKIKSAFAAAALAFFATAATASTITYSIRDITSAVGSDYAAGWNAQSSAVSTSNLNAFTNQLGQNNGYDHLSVTFDIGNVFAGGSLLFQFAPDAGYGGALYVNNSLQQTSAGNDLWWGYDWNNTGALLSTSFANIAQGAYSIDLYWAEGCCNGGQSARFSADGGNTWQELSISNLDALAVPEPGSLALLGLGLSGLAAIRRKKA